MRCWLPLLLSLATSSAHADDEDVGRLVDALRAEPMSLFDWGLFRLEDELQQVRRHQRDFLRVIYRPDVKLIVIDAVFFVEPEEIASVTSEKACYTRHHAIKLLFGVIDTDKIHLAPASDFRLGMKFSHHDSDLFPELPDAGEVGAKLLKRVFVQVGINSNPDKFPFEQEMRCTGYLLEQDVNYGISPEEELR